MLGKLNCYVARIGILLIAVALIAGMVSYAARPIGIRDWYDLNAIRDNLGGSYLLMNDLDSTTPGYRELASPSANGGRGWEPIGSVLILIHGHTTFEGTFDGQGYEIHDLFINQPMDGVGLFAVVGGGGRIKDIGVVNATVTGWGLVGLFALVEVGGRIENISVVNATVTGDYYVGGLAGRNLYGTVSNSYATGRVNGNSSVGGLVGQNDRGTVSNSYATGTVVGSGWWVGGLLGTNGGTVSNSYSTGNVTGDDFVGGLVGLDLCDMLSSYAGTVNNSFWDTETSGQATSAGGTGKTTAEMRSIATFSGAGWNITAVGPGQTNPAYIWNIVDNETYPFLSWET
jgi:hypothetical protein